MHPDGDELLYLLDGEVHVALDDQAGERIVAPRPGKAFVVPRGTWHRVLVKEPCRLLFFTPGRSQVRRRRPSSSQSPLSRMAACRHSRRAGV